MASNSLIYSFVARGTVVLAEYTSFSGNFSTIAVQCLQKLPANNRKQTYTCDGHTFNYLVEGGFAYLVVAEESFGRQIPFAFLERVKNDFVRRYAGGRADTAIAHGLDSDFRNNLKEHMVFFSAERNDPNSEANKLSHIQSQVSEVKGIMMGNIDKILDRGVQLEVLVDQTEDLRSQADEFRGRSRQLRSKMCMQNMKAKLIVLSVVIALILIIWLSVCRGFKCK